MSLASKQHEARPVCRADMASTFSDICSCEELRLAAEADVILPVPLHWLSLMPLAVARALGQLLRKRILF